MLCRLSLILTLLLGMAGCGGGRQESGGVRRLAVLPIEDLHPQATQENRALSLGILAAFPASEKLQVQMLNARRDLSSVGHTDLLDGYVGPGTYQLLLNGDTAIGCSGDFATCYAQLLSRLGEALGTAPKPTAKPESLLAMVRVSGAGPEAEAVYRRITATDPGFAPAWLAFASLLDRTGGPAAGRRLLESAPLDKMNAEDAAQVRLAIAMRGDDTEGRVAALVAAAQASAGNVGLWRQASSELTARRRYNEALTFLDKAIPVSQDPSLLNDAVYVAAIAGDRARAEKYVAALRAAAPQAVAFADTEGEIAYWFGDYPKAAQAFEQASLMDVTFQGGIELWKASEAYRMAGNPAKSDEFLQRFIELRNRSGQQRNGLFIQAVSHWRRNQPEEAAAKLRDLEATSERGRAFFFQALLLLAQRNFTGAENLRRQMEERSAEAVLLRSLSDGSTPPPGLQVPPKAVAALHAYLRGDQARAAALLREAQLHPVQQGAFGKLEALVNGKKPERGFPASPDDWVAFVLER